MELLLPIAASVLGIAGTILAWRLNPKRRIYVELDDIYSTLAKPGGLWEQLATALRDNNKANLTVLTLMITELQSRAVQLQTRLK